MGKKDSKPRSAPSTTAITPAALASTLTAFSPSSESASYFAHLHRAPDSHTLRIYEVASGRCVTRWAGSMDADSEEKVSSLCWVLLPAPAGAEADAEGKRGKKRRKSGGAAELDEALAVSGPKLVLALGLENGSIVLVSPVSATPITLAHPSCAGSALTFLAAPVGASSGHLWSISGDGQVRVWELSATGGTVIARIAGLKEGANWDDLAVKYLPLVEEGAKKQSVQLILSHLTIHLYSCSISTAAKKDKVKDIKIVELGKCTGHIDLCHVAFTGLHLATAATDSAMVDSDDEDADDSETIKFVSYSKTDRFVQAWSLALVSGAVRDAKLLARLGLETSVQSISLGSSSLNSSEEEILAAVDTAGRVSLARLPNRLPEGKKVLALEIESALTGREGEGAGVSQLLLTQGDKLVLCRGAVKPVFEIIDFTEENGSWIAAIKLEKIGAGLLNGSANLLDASAPAPTRYSEIASSTARSGNALAEATSDDEVELENNGELDVDMAEPTLAERLKALKVGKTSTLAAGDVDAEEEDEDSEEDDEEDEGAKKVAKIPSTTLTTTLIQALHSSDMPLLESCLTHTSPTLIRATVKRLNSGTLVLALLEVLVEKLGKGKSGTGVNGGSVASVKRARGLIEWVRQVLVVHVGFLVTIPSLVNRLSALHSTLTARLALQPTLLALNGRLELVMSQIELRQERSAAATVTQTKKIGGSGKRYVEGESSEGEDDDAEDSDEFDLEEDSDEGSIEDVVLGSEDSDEEMDDDEEEEEESGEEGSGSKGRRVNGRIGGDQLADLLELEAEEGDDDDEDSEEDEEEEEQSESDEE